MTRQKVFCRRLKHTKLIKVKTEKKSFLLRLFVRMQLRFINLNNKKADRSSVTWSGGYT